MSTAQLLIAIAAPTEVSAERFQAAVGAALRAQGLTGSAWTYDATSATLASDGTAATVTDGPWAGVTFNTATATGSRRVVISAFRQNAAGLPDDVVRADSMMAAVSDAARAALAAGATGYRSAVRTLRHAISWDRGVPRSIPLDASAGGSGIGWGVVATLGAIGLFLAGGQSKRSAPARMRRGRRRGAYA